MNMYLTKIILSSVLLCVSHAVLAVSWYQVEVIVFDRLYPDLDGEKWRSVVFQPKNNMIELRKKEGIAASSRLIPFMILSADKNRFSGIDHVFKRSVEYRTLYHFSWQQPATVHRQTSYVRIHKSVGKQINSVVNKTENFDGTKKIGGLAKSGRILDGAIRIRSGYYLHVDVDLYYLRKLPQENMIIRTHEELNRSKFEKTVVTLKETRKIKLNELHYFDHPLFGAIIQVTRL